MHRARQSRSTSTAEEDREEFNRCRSYQKKSQSSIWRCGSRRRKQFLPARATRSSRCSLPAPAGQHTGGPAYFPNLPQFPDSIAEEIAIVDRPPRETPRSISHAYAVSIEAAQKNIQIVNPYFVPTKSIRKAIKKALKKGTEVEIMIPAVSDIPFTPEASFYIAHKLMKRGAKIYLFKDGFHHSKVMMVDSTFCTVGTANLNSRSLRYDYETNAFIFDPSTTNQLNSMFERDKKNSTLLTPEMWKKRSGWKKFLGWVGNLLTPFL